MPVIERDRHSPDLLRQTRRAFEGAVRYDDRAHPSGNKTPRGSLADLSSSQHHDRPPVQIPEDFSREIDGHRSDRRGSAGDLGFAPHLLGHPERVLEKLVEMAGGCPAIGGRSIRLLELAQDLGLADNHRIQAARNTEQMPDARGGFVRVERGVAPAGSLLKVSAKPVQHPERTDACRVILDPVAGRNNNRSRKPVDPADPRERLLELVRADGKFFPDIDRRAPVVDARADDIHLSEERYWMAGSASRAAPNTSIEASAARRGGRRRNLRRTRIAPYAAQMRTEARNFRPLTWIPPM